MQMSSRIEAFFYDEFKRGVAFTIVSLPALVISFVWYGGHAYGGEDAGLHVFYDPSWIAVILCGVPIIKRAFQRFFTTGTIRAGMLVSLAIIAAVAIGELFAAGEVAFIMTLGHLLESRTLRKARAGIQALMHLELKQASLVVDGVESLVE